MADWFADEEFWEVEYDFMFPPERFEKTPEEVDRVLALTGVEGGAVLDLCSGPGRHSVELARRGFSVTGVDRTPFLMEKARARAEGAGVAVEWVEADMREFSRPESFDLALSMFTSFGYFEDEADDARVLANLLASLKPGGILLMEMVSKEKLANIYQASGAEWLADGRILVERRHVLDGWERIRTERIILDGERIVRDELTLRIYSGRELRLLLEAAGFADVRIYGDLAGNEYGTEAMRLVAVARKP